jgi:hypothetical protein
LLLELSLLVPQLVNLRLTICQHLLQLRKGKF